MDEHILSTHGFIEPGAAAGFLYRTDSSIGIIEGYISNPAAGMTPRAVALNEITAKLLELAESSGVEHVIAICREASVERLALKHRLRLMGEYLMFSKDFGRHGWVA